MWALWSSDLPTTDWFGNCFSTAGEVSSLADMHIVQRGAQTRAANHRTGAEDHYAPTAYEDEEKKRILATIDRRMASKSSRPSLVEPASTGQVMDLMEALQAKSDKGRRQSESCTQEQTHRDHSTSDEEAGPEDEVLHFNRAVALERVGRLDDAEPSHAMPRSIPLMRTRTTTSACSGTGAVTSKDWCVI